eukprot:Em0005g1441a
MDEQYTHAVLRAVVVQLCQPLGLNALQSSACDVLVYLLKSYLHIVAKTTAGYNIHETWELEKDLEVSSSEELSPGSVPEPTPCIANVESERVRTDTDEDEEVEGGHGAKVKLHGGQLHVEGWETEEEVIKASPICDVDGWLFPCSWEVLPSLEDLEDDLSVGEEAVNMLNRKHVMKHKPTLQGAHGVGNTLPPHLGEQESFSLVVSISKRLLEGHKISGPVQKFGIGEHGPLYLPALERSKKKLSKHRRKRELDISEIEPIGKESKKIKIISQPCFCSGSSSDGEGTHLSHDCNAKQRVELKAAEPSLKSDKKVGSLSKGFSHKTKIKKSKPHQLPAVVSAVTHPSSHKVSDTLPPPTVPIGSDYNVNNMTMAHR